MAQNVMKHAQTIVTILIHVIMWMGPVTVDANLALRLILVMKVYAFTAK